MKKAIKTMLLFSLIGGIVAGVVFWIKSCDNDFELDDLSDLDDFEDWP